MITITIKFEENSGVITQKVLADRVNPTENENASAYPLFEYARKYCADLSARSGNAVTARLPERPGDTTSIEEEMRRVIQRRLRG